MKFKQEIDYVSEKELDFITENKEEYYNGTSPLDSRRFENIIIQFANSVMERRNSLDMDLSFNTQTNFYGKKEIDTNTPLTFLAMKKRMILEN